MDVISYNATVSSCDTWVLFSNFSWFSARYGKNRGYLFTMPPNVDPHPPTQTNNNLGNTEEGSGKFWTQGLPEDSNGVLFVG